jgi:type II pantothenate kinase
MIAVFAARADGMRDVVLTGNLTNVPQGMEVFASLSELFGITFHWPQHAEYATAVGSAIVFDRGGQFTEIGNAAEEETL